MFNITEEKWIEMLEKKADGTYIVKYPKVKSKSGITFDEHLAEEASQEELGHVRLNAIPSISNLEKAKYFYELTTSGIWSKPSDVKQIYVEMYGAGGGGGDGGYTNESTDKDVRGGQGGGGGAFLNFVFNADVLPDDVTYVVGAGGQAGTSGGATMFYLLTANGGSGGKHGAKSTSSVASARAATSNTSLINGGSGAQNRPARYSYTGAELDGNDGLLGGASGGNGGNIRVDGTYDVGGVGGRPMFFSNLPQTPSGQNGSAPENNRSPGSAGGGGSANISGRAADGGNGGIASGGGGGGASYVTKGKGGHGGNGLIRIWCW